MSDHILPILENAIARSMPALFDTQQFTQAIDHLLVCAECAIGVTLLSEVATNPALIALQAHATAGPQLPDEWEEIEYLIVLRRGGAAAARLAFPMVAIHMENCLLCQETVKASQEVLAQSPIRLVVTPKPALWQQLPNRTKRLFGTYRVAVQRMSVAITCTLPHAQIRSTGAYVLDLLQDSGVPERQQIQTFRLELRIEDEQVPPQALVDIQIEAFYSRRVQLRIQAWSATSGDNTTALPLAEVAWEIRHDAQSADDALLCAGETDVAGLSYSYLDPDTFGALVLTIQVNGHRWQVPLVITTV